MSKCTDSSPLLHKCEETLSFVSLPDASTYLPLRKDEVKIQKVPNLRKTSLTSLIPASTPKLKLLPLLRNLVPG